MGYASKCGRRYKNINHGDRKRQKGGIMSTKDYRMNITWVSGGRR